MKASPDISRPRILPGWAESYRFDSASFGETEVARLALPRTKYRRTLWLWLHENTLETSLSTWEAVVSWRVGGTEVFRQTFRKGGVAAGVTIGGNSVGANNIQSYSAGKGTLRLHNPASNELYEAFAFPLTIEADEVVLIAAMTYNYGATAPVATGLAVLSEDVLNAC